MSFLSQVASAVIVLFQGITVGEEITVCYSLYCGVNHCACTDHHLATVMSCDVEGELRLDFAQGGQPLDQTEYYLIQVCILGEWSYVCHWNFDYQGVDTDVVLQQLQCSNGSKGRIG